MHVQKETFALLFTVVADVNAIGHLILDTRLHGLVTGTLKQRFINIGYDPTPTSSEEMIAVMRKTGDDWTPLIKRLNIKLD